MGNESSEVMLCVHCESRLTDDEIKYYGHECAVCFADSSAVVSDGDVSSCASSSAGHKNDAVKPRYSLVPADGDVMFCVRCDVRLTEHELRNFGNECEACLSGDYVVSDSFSRPFQDDGRGLDDGMVIYIASPYSHATSEVMKQRFEHVEAFTAELIKQGKVVFSPIVHCHQMGINHNLPTDFVFWQEYCLKMLAMADVLWVMHLDGWNVSVGVQAEIMFAYEHGLTVVHEVDVSRFVEGSRNG